MSKKKNQKVPLLKSSKSAKQYIKEAARKLPIFECFESKENSEGLKTVVVSRIKRNENKVIGIYLLDMYCLGVKNCNYYSDLDTVEYRNLIDKLNPSYQPLMPCTANRAFNLVYGALEYAEDLGFDPDEDFEVAEYILDPAEDIEFEDIAFGKNGKPFYISGPYDNTPKILKTLEKNVGIGNFEVVMNAFDDDDFDFDEDDEFDFDLEDDDDEDENYTDFEEVK